MTTNNGGERLVRELVDWSDLRTFYAVATAGSMNAAAEQLGVTQSAISKRLGQLELRLGARLLERLARQLGEAGLQRIDARELRRFRYFYSAYPQIPEAVTPVLAALPPGHRLDLPEIRESVTPESAPVAPVGTSRPPTVDPRQLLDRLSFTHFSELLQIDEPLKRLFYEVETLRGNWSVRELKRQIATQYFERSGEMETFLRRALGELGVDAAGDG